jgi:hypothetical protein
MAKLPTFSINITCLFCFFHFVISSQNDYRPFLISEYCDQYNWQLFHAVCLMAMFADYVWNHSWVVA